MDWLLNPDTVTEKFIVMGIGIALFVAVMSLILFLVDRPKRIPSWVVAIGFVGPALLLIAYGLLRPGLETLYNSFFNRTTTEFVGFDNYVTMLTGAQFQKVLVVTAAWVVLAPLVSTLIGLIYAVLVDRARFEKIAKTLIFIPMAISMVGASIIWGFVYEFRPDQPGIEQIGLLNQLLVWIGLPPQQFLIGEPWNTGFLIVVMIWIQTGFAMTVLAAAIKAIPDDIVEAARLDGLHGLGMFRYITVPSIRPALVVVLTTIAMTTLKAFDIVRTMTGGQFGTQIIANEFYTQAFRQNNQGLAAALAVVLFILVVPIVAYNVRQMRRSEEIR
ncbi:MULTISPECIES: carbohydrate ABC transporter permease [unclassified Isoptericola]|uniref:carbohydrate ABC transporter permease n=1 Tax=unclassified Isoptericola TaxID=2623355 RepID=UPI0027124CA8|nr:MULTISPECIES: sugar ABC transporter permease [unclassified Isoptericola]MDO8145731.1 sugar ABC transporter permease [Isoptericola sp. 178]MDO8147928.1 sugar ABC transporter permease [Isoptericola sp. b515]MDO8149811.1 sugar ABC transporter permease [Isoptericola sp. b408]